MTRRLAKVSTDIAPHAPADRRSRCLPPQRLRNRDLALHDRSRARQAGQDRRVHPLRVGLDRDHPCPDPRCVHPVGRLVFLVERLLGRLLGHAPTRPGLVPHARYPVGGGRPYRQGHHHHQAQPAQGIVDQLVQQGTLVRRRRG
jgi:hypothetical protein